MHRDPTLSSGEPQNLADRRTDGLEQRDGPPDQVDRELASRPAARARLRPPGLSAGAALGAVGAAVAIGVVILALVVIRPAGAPTAGSSPATAPQLGDAPLVALSWVGASDGWALAAARCTVGNCAQLPASRSRLAYTADGGAHWHALPDPPASVRGATGACSRTACVSAVRFATPTVGYLYDPDLLMTTDGGRSWRAQPGAKVATITVANGKVYRVAYHHSGCPGPCDPALQEAKIGSGNWRTLIRRLAYPDRGGQAQIVATGRTLLLAMYGDQAGPFSAQATIYRSIDSGASWRRQVDPCSGRGPNGGHVEDDLIDLAAVPGGFFAGLCSPHAGAGAFVVTSNDGGASWQAAGVLPIASAPGRVAAASSTTLAVSTAANSGTGAFTARLLVSTDAGRHWSTAATDTQRVTRSGVPAWLGFQSTTDGRWIGDPHHVWTTTDGAAHWSRAALR